MNSSHHKFGALLPHGLFHTQFTIIMVNELLLCNCYAFAYVNESKQTTPKCKMYNFSYQ